MIPTRSYASVPLAFAAAVLLAACVDLTKPWSGRTDAASDAGSGTGAGGTIAVTTDAGSGGSGGSVAFGGSAATGGAATGGTMTGGTTGTTQADAGFVIDAAPTGETSESGAGDTAGTLAVDAETLSDAPAPQDLVIDVPLFVDSNAPMDVAAESFSSAETGTPDGAGTAAADSSGADGSGDAEADGARLPQILSIDFVGGMPSGSAPPSGTVAMGASESAGVKPATHWNSATDATGTLSSLVLASGAATAASASWTMTPIDGAIDTWSNSFIDAPGDTRMMNGYLDPRSSTLPATINVTGLPDPMNSGYDVYVYCYSYIDSSDRRLYEYSIGSTTYSVTQTGPSTTTFPGYALASGADGGSAGAGNYVVFRNVIGSSFTLTAQPRTSTYGTQRAPVNGMQIVYPSGY
jgi:hypothetical protein